MKRSLLIGAGKDRRKKVYLKDNAEWAGELVTLDIDPHCGADVVFDLARLTEAHPHYLFRSRMLPFQDETFDELGAYDTLEHFGQQGDWRGWFTEMAEFHRVLKPGGVFGIIVPIGEDALADPGHTRFFQANWFLMLSRRFYDDAQGVTDYRWYNTCWWDVLFMERQGNHHLAVLLGKA